MDIYDLCMLFQVLMSAFEILLLPIKKLLSSVWDDK